jgi:anti-sigma-K factor RskA
MVLGISLVWQIRDLKSQLLAARTDATGLRESNALARLRLMTLDVKEAAYGSSQILVAWDSYRHQGVVTAQNLPAASAGHDYQLWVLDPGAEAPLDAGLLTGSRVFRVMSASTPYPGFAVSLEPTGGSPEPTGPILFAVAPGP